MSSASPVTSWLEERRTDMVDDLRLYVEHETPSDDKQLLDEGLTWVREWIAERLPDASESRFVDGAEFGDAVIVDIPSPTLTDRFVSALCHYDTVWPRGTGLMWPVRIDGDMLTGPGAFDMKAGLVQLVWAIKCADTCGLARPNVRLILTGDEEIGSPTSRSLIEKEVAGSEAVLVFEASVDGAVKTSRKGVGLFTITVDGVEAHAGLDPGKGVSAIDEMARVVRALHDVNDAGSETTVNVGTISGGSRANVTAGSATADIDVRVESNEEARRVDELLSALAPSRPSARITVSGEWNRPVMARTAGTALLYDEARKAAADLGFELREAAVGGASDGNFAAAKGLPVLDGLGAIGGGAHARNEWVSLNGMIERAALTAVLLDRLMDCDPSPSRARNADSDRHRPGLSRNGK